MIRRRRSPWTPATGGALVAFLATALVLVVGLAVWMRARPASFGITAGSGPPAAPPAARPAPTEPEGPLARYVPRPVAPALPLDDEERARIELYREARRSVCLISSLDRAQVPAGAELPTYDQHVRGTGTGFVWDTEGHVVTSYHVVEGARGATVTLADGSVHEGWLVGLDREHDLAVMRIDAPRELLHALRFGTSRDLLVGQRVYSIGYPYELEHTFSAGMICGLDRAVGTPGGVVLRGLIQTDADLHPGSSGGPLLDSSGRVIGLATAVHADSVHGAGVAFALPVDVMQAIVPRIMRAGFEWFPELGLVLESDANSRQLLARMRDIGAARDEPWLENVPDAGVVIAIVQEGSPAAASGLRQMQAGRTTSGASELAVKDIIVEVNGSPVTSRDELDQLFHAARGEDELELVVARAGGRATVRIPLEPPADADAPR